LTFEDIPLKSAATVFSQIQSARERLAPYLPATPVVLSEVLGRMASQRVWLKLETMQPTGAFKVRPAFNSILANLEQARQCGVVTSSSGNFAQATAFAARALGVDAHIIMMRNASPFKIERTKAYGGTVVPCGNTFQERWDTTFRVQRESNRLLIHPYDSEETIAGDGTIGCELADQLEGDLCVLVPVSGGGLISGISTALKTLRPGCRVIGVQPAANPSMQASLRAGEPVTVTSGTTLADALVATRPGDRTFALAQQFVDDVVTVDEDEIVSAVKTLAVEQKLVVEAGGAVGVAALLAGKVDAKGLDVVCILSGGNILPAKLAELLA
jgi:threonine dehydratase